MLTVAHLQVTGLQVAVSEQAIAGLLVAVARTAGFVMVSPPFNTRSVPNQAKVAVAVALALPLSLRMADTAPPLKASSLVLAMIAQLVVGLVLGFFVLLAVATLQSVGDLLDAVGGFQISAALDPLMLVQNAVMGRLTQLIAVTLLFVTDGHLVVVQGLSRSVASMPGTALHWNQVGAAITQDVAGLALASLEVAAPVMAAMLIADLALGLLTRAAPALNAFSLGFPLKILFALMLTGLIVARMPQVLEAVVNHAVLNDIGVTASG